MVIKKICARNYAPKKFIISSKFPLILSLGMKATMWRN